MKLHLENIGKISKADVEINGITVIAGENNTGKSTVGKVLFSVFFAFSDLENQILDSRINTFAKDLKHEFYEKYSDLYRLDCLNLSETMFKNGNWIYKDDEAISNLILNNITDNPNRFYEDIKHNKPDITKDFLNRVKELYRRCSSLSEDRICQSYFNALIVREFDNQICNEFSDIKCSKIILYIKDKYIDIDIDNNSVAKINRNIFSLVSNVLYVYDPVAVDNAGTYPGTLLVRRNNANIHTGQLFLDLIQGDKVKVESAMYEAMVMDKMENILDKINTVCSGSLSYSSSNGFSYQDEKYGIKMNVKNISSGLKVFATVKELLINGSLKENGTIILDEPEVHLHPEWQILLAEIIVMLQKEFNMHILLTTHSPYFLEAIEVYSQKYKIDSKCKYYLAENVGNTAAVSDVTNDTELIYKKLARPFQELENVRYSDHED